MTYLSPVFKPISVIQFGDAMRDVRFSQWCIRKDKVSKNSVIKWISLLPTLYASLDAGIRRGGLIETKRA